MCSTMPSARDGGPQLSSTAYLGAQSEDGARETAAPCQTFPFFSSKSEDSEQLFLSSTGNGVHAAQPCSQAHQNRYNPSGLLLHSSTILTSTVSYCLYLILLHAPVCLFYRFFFKLNFATNQKSVPSKLSPTSELPMRKVLSRQQFSTEASKI